MIVKSLAFLLLALTAGGTALGQQTPEAKKADGNLGRAFAWSFSNDGGYLGVQTQEVTKENFAKFGLREVRGVAVEKVMEESPAAAAGIQSGDVIVKFNGEEITSVRKLTRLVGEIDPDHKANITVIRGGNEREITVTVGRRPAPRFADGNFSFALPPMGKLELPEMGKLPELPKGEIPRVLVPGGQGNVFMFGGNARQIGVGTTALTKQLAEHFRVEAGLMISEVRENSPAAKAGLKAGDIIVEADGKPVKSQFDLIRAINEKKDGDLQLTIVRGGSRQTIQVTPEASKEEGFFYRLDTDEDAPSTDGPGLMRSPGRMNAPTPVPAPLMRYFEHRVI